MILQVEIEECRISRLLVSQSHLIRACLEVSYLDGQIAGTENASINSNGSTRDTASSGKRYRSRDERVKPGSCLMAPARQGAETLTMKIFYVNEGTKETVIVGKCSWGWSILRKLVNPGSSVDLTSTIKSRSGSGRDDLKVGRLSCRLSLRLESSEAASASSPVDRGALLTAASGLPQPFPHFEFKPLDVQLDWSYIVHNVEVDDLLIHGASEDSQSIKTLFSTGKHLATGYSTAGRGDEPVHNAFKMQQLSLQYLHYTCEALRGKEAAIEGSLRSLALEEQSCDNIIVGLKARAKNLQKQCRSLDRLRGQYVGLFGEEAKTVLASSAASQAAANQDANDSIPGGEDEDAEDNIVYTVEEYDKLHPSSKKQQPPSDAKGAKAAAVTVSKSQEKGLKAESQNRGKSSTNSDSDEDVQTIVADRKANSPLSKRPTQSRDSGSSNSRSSSDDSAEKENIETLDLEPDSHNVTGEIDTSQFSDVDVPIQLSWLPPKHQGGTSGSGRNSGWVSANVRHSLGSTAMSQDSLNPPQSRPQTAQSAQTAMSVDSLAKAGEGETPEVLAVESVSSLPPQDDKQVKEDKVSNKEAHRANPRQQIVSHFPRDWVTNPVDGSLNSFSRDADGTADGDDSMVNANVTMTKDASAIGDANALGSVVHRPEEDPWNDISIARDSTTKEPEKSPEQIKAAYENAVLEDFEESAFNLSIDNTEDNSPGMPAVQRAPSADISNQDSDSAVFPAPEVGDQPVYADISHISSPTVKDDSNTDSTIYFRSKRNDESLGEKLSSLPQRHNQSSGLHISYTEDDTIAVEKKSEMSADSKSEEKGYSARGADMKRGSKPSGGYSYRQPETNSTGGADTSYGHGSFYDQSMDDYMGSGDISMDRSGRNNLWIPRGADEFHFADGPAPRGSTYNSQESFQTSSFNQSASQSYDRLDAFATNARGQSPQPAMDGFRDESKSSTAGGHVSYSRRTSHSEAKDHKPVSKYAPGMRTKILDSFRSADAKDSNSPNTSYADDFDDYGHASNDDGDVLLGTLGTGLSPRSNLGSTLSATENTGEQRYLGRSSNSDTQVDRALSGGYNSVDRLKGLLGGAAEVDSTPAEARGNTRESGMRARTDALWRSGRAQLSAIDTGTALDVHISAVRLDEAFSRLVNSQSMQLQFSFLGQLSDRSDTLNIPKGTNTLGQQLVTLQYSAHLGPSAQGDQLREEIAGEEEAVSITVLIRDPATGATIGHANINLWMMIEDSTNIFRHEVDIFSSGNGVDDGALIGTIFVDVRGYRMLLNHYTMYS